MEEVLVHPCMVHFEHDPQICAKCSSPGIEFGSLHAVGFQARGQNLLHRVFPECSDFAVRESALQVEPSYIDCGHCAPPVSTDISQMDGSFAHVGSIVKESIEECVR